MKISRLILLALLALTSISKNFIKGLVEISPSVLAPVCQAGDQLELTCTTTTGIFLRWEITIFPDNMTHAALVTSAGPSGIPPPLTISRVTSTFTFSRVSGPNSSPLISRMVVSPVSSGLNGTVVNCFEGSSSTDSVATTSIYIVGGNINSQTPELSIRSHSRKFLSESITVVFEWNVSNLQIYHQQLLQNVSINVLPHPVAITYTETRTLQLTLLYNTLYIVNITQPGICGQPSQTVFIELSYSKCSNLTKLLVHTDVIAVGYNHPALEGASIMFICPTRGMLNGPNSSTCMGNGEWEPDSREVNCTSEAYVTPGITMSKIPDSSPATATINLRTALISVTCVLVMMSAVTFIAGFICGHCTCISQRWRKSAKKNDRSPPNTTTGPGEDLELKENVAYITIRPK